MKKAWVGLLDCNNFFVSCERLFRPDLMGKPVVVLSSNDGCIVARSQEVKDMNVSMGVPYFQVKDMLEKAGTTTFSSNFALYRDISRRVFSVMQEELGMIDQYSIDEAFFTLDSHPETTASQLKKVVEKRVGIPVSIGLAKTKTQAKYANLLAKKQTGIWVLNEADWLALTPSIPLSKIWGVGGRLELKYKQYGLKTVADLLQVDTERLTRLFGVGGVRLQKELQGIIVAKLLNHKPAQQSIISSRSFSKATTDLAVLADAVAYHVRHAGADLRAMNMETTSIRVSIRPSSHGDFLLRGGSKEAVLSGPTSNTIALLKVANQLLKELYEKGVPYKKAGITLGKFISADHGQGALFESAVSDRQRALMDVVDKLNIKQNSEVILLGSHLQNTRWQTKSNTRSPAYTTQWKDVAGAKCI